MNSKDSSLNANPNEFNPFSGAEIIKVIPTTESQLEIWLSCAIGGDDANRGFNESISLKFEGQLNVKAFEEALYTVVYRHDALHSAFSADGSKMMVFNEIPFNYFYEDLSKFEKLIRDQKIEDYIKADAYYVFDLLNGPLIKFGLYKLSEVDYFFIFNAHHIICDGWSLGVILQDISKLYSAFSSNLLPEMEEADSFSEYAKEQSEFVKGNIYQTNLQYWVKKHQNIIPDLNLPFDFIRPIKKTYSSSRIEGALNEELLISLKSIGVKVGSSTVNTLLAAYELFLSQITGQKDIIVGLPAADQAATGRFSLVGHCVNLLPLKSKIDDEQSFIDYLKYRKSEILDAYEHQQFTFGSLIKNLKINRDPSRVPLLPVVFNVDMEMDQGVNFSGLKFTTISNVKAFRNFEFSLNIWGRDNQLVLEWSYNNQLFERTTIEKMMSDFEQLLQSIVANPNQKLEHLLRHYPVANNTSSNDTFLLESSRNYYLSLFSGELPVLDFPFDRARSINTAFVPSEYQHSIKNETFAAITDYQLKSNATYASLLLSAVEVLLYKYSGETDLIIGLKEPETKTRALRQTIHSERNFNQLLESNTNQLKEGITHQQYTLSNLLRDLTLSKQGSRNGLFDIKVSIENVTSETTTIDYLEETLGVQDLHFKFKINKEGIEIALLYNQSLLDASTAARMLFHLDNLLLELIHHSEESIQSVEYISSQERKEIIELFNATSSAYPKEETVTSLFEQQVEQTPDHTALVFEERRYTYGQLNALSNQFGNYLREHYSIQADDLVGIKLERSEWLILSILGILKSGGAYVPIDPEYPQDRIDYLITNSQCKVVIDKSMIESFEQVAMTYASTNLTPINKSSDLVYVIYTSGSTGQPKGVMVEHRNLINYNTWFVNTFKIGSDDATMLLSSFTFDGVNTSLFGSLLSGSTLFVLSNALIKSPRDLSKYVHSNNISYIKITPSHLNLILSDKESYDNFISAPKLRLLIVGGDKINKSDIERIKKDNDSIEIINHYGPTETTVGVIFSKIKLPASQIPIGSPISNTQIFILDQDQKVCPIGVLGEIYIGGDSVTRGYLYNNQLSLEKFVNNPFKSGERLYRTGDMAKWLDGGQIDFQGRKDFQLKIRGYRVEAGEIEGVLNTFKGIERSVVISKGDGENQVIIGFFVANQPIDNLQLRQFVEKKIPAYMVPAFFEQIQEIPLLPSGKINRNALLNYKITRSNSESSTFSTKEEVLVAKIWSDLLNVEHIDKKANFFELGGHSLIAIRVVIRIENETNIKLPMSTLFEFPTIEKLAQLLEQNETATKWKTLVPIKTSGSKVPLYIVHGGGLGVMVFHHLSKYIDDDQPLYGLQALGIDGQDEPLSSIEAMAAFYLSEILEQNPNGPYSLAGHSSGGLVALEIAQQLKKTGKVVKSLTIFDFNISEAKRNFSIKEKLERQVIHFFPLLLFSLKSIIKQPIKTFKYYLLIWGLRLISMKNRLGPNKNIEMNSIFFSIDKAIAKNTEAIRKYNASPYDGDLNLFKSSDKVNFQEDPIYLGWKPYIIGEIFIYNAKGNHDEMITPPNIILFAKDFQQILDNNQ